MKIPQEVKIRVLRKTTDDPLQYLIRREFWSPYEAACALRGLVPGEIDTETGSAVAYWHIDPRDEASSLEEFDPQEDYGEDICELTKLIVANNGGNDKLSPDAIVRWALRKSVIGRMSPLANAFYRLGFISDDSPQPTPKDSTDVEASLALIQSLEKQLIDAKEEIGRLIGQQDELRRKAKETGKQWLETRCEVYSAALHRLSLHVAEILSDGQCGGKSASPGNSIKGARVIASRLAQAVHDHRVFYGFPEEDKNPSYNTMVDHLEKALNDDRRSSSSQKKPYQI